MTIGKRLISLVLACALAATCLAFACAEDAADAYAQGRQYDEQGDYESAYACYLTAAEAGNAEAMFNLGWMYTNGQGVSRDDVKAVEWYQKAADLGNVDAMVNLGLMYLFGQGVSPNDAKAAEWFQKAADLGDSVAMSNLGQMYFDGRGVPQNDAKAAELFQKSADLGYAGAMSNLGVMYANGIGVPKDRAKAVEWYQKAADLGEVTAMRNLGECYEKGLGVPQDDVNALAWYQKAAALGHEFAQQKVAEMQAAGRGTPQTTQPPHIVVTDADFPVDSYLVLGRYEQDGNADNGPEPIEWLVLEREGNYALVVSRMLLSNAGFDERFSYSTEPDPWETSSIRSHVSRIVQSALTPSEQTCLVPVEHDGVTDTAFLLSRAEVEALLPIPAFRICNATVAAQQEAKERRGNYAASSAKDMGYEWWLRDSSETSPNFAAVVTSTGSIDYTNKGGFCYDDHHNYVRPAIRIDLSLGCAKPAQ